MRMNFFNQKCKIFQKLLLLHIIILKGSMEVKKLEMDELDIFGLFLVGVFSKLALIVEFISFF